MNLKSKAISLAVIIILCVSVPVHSQGLFKNDATPTQENTTTNRGGLLRGPGDPPVQPPGLETDTTPIGEGLAILSLLSGGFFMLKRRDSKK